MNTELGDWGIFRIKEKNPPKTRDIETVEGIGDRLRSAAFAEIQARDAFLWAAHTFSDAPFQLKNAWQGLARAENKHLNQLLSRMEDLGQKIEERAVSDRLWKSLTTAKDAESFALYMAAAEERGRQAGERFQKLMAEIDPISSELFGKIAKEEVEHIELAAQFFPSSFKKMMNETF